LTSASKVRRHHESGGEKPGVRAPDDGAEHWANHLEPIVAAIGNGEVFSNGRDFAAWLGLVPRQLSTGARTIFGKIPKRG
jgi:Transposase IS116/IS110/IS902 family